MSVCLSAFHHKQHRDEQYHMVGGGSNIVTSTGCAGWLCDELSFEESCDEWPYEFLYDDFCSCKETCHYFYSKTFLSLSICFFHFLEECSPLSMVL